MTESNRHASSATTITLANATHGTCAAKRGTLLTFSKTQHLQQRAIVRRLEKALLLELLGEKHVIHVVKSDILGGTVKS